ncbi:DedA family protein [Balneatrix alpica]|uniref:DedA family protein n=1 Tax=Balneatrix alpica TaxID=75684 RepID=A0ABV5ZAC0_9GAMM|nr:VTT domain-containing protein [Balneatrix alpica]
MAELTQGALVMLAWLDGLFPFSLLVPGEPAFIAAGYQWRGGQGWPLVVAVWLAAYSADQLSYALGYYRGSTWLRRWGRQRHYRRHLARARLQLRRRGMLMVMLSRLLGPLAWITPVLSGSLRLPYRHFALASAFAVTLGTGQFMLLGAFGHQLLPNLGELWQQLNQAGQFSLVLLLLAGLLYLLYRHHRLPSRL